MSHGSDGRDEAAGSVGHSGSTVTCEPSEGTAAPMGGGYEAPGIAWREPYQPLSFGISCAKQPGNPGCNPGPFSS